MGKVNSKLGKDKEELKRQIQNYWSENVPGLIDSSAPLGSKGFYIEIDAHRYRQEPYIPKYIKEICEPGKRILEIGCGLGTDSRQFAKEGMKAVAMDLSFSNVLHTKRGFEMLGLKGYFVTADAEHLPFKESAFDIVYSCGVLHHTPDTQKAIEEIHRVLKKEGKILIMLYHKGLAYRWISLQYLLRKLYGDRTSKEDLITKKYDHTPLSKMYSKNEARSMFAKFKDLEISIVTFGGVKENKKLWWIYYLLNTFPFLMNKLGSFLIIKAKK